MNFDRFKAIARAGRPLCRKYGHNKKEYHEHNPNYR